MSGITNETISANVAEKQFKELHATLIGKIPEGDFDILSGIHAGHLFNIINYRVVCLKDVHAVLFVTDAFQKDQIRRLVECGIFDAAIIWDGSVGFTTSSIKTEADILAYFDSLMSQTGIEFCRIGKAFLFSDVHDQAGTYFDIRKVKVVPIETNAGAFENKWRYESFHDEGKIGDDLYRMQKEHHILSGENKECRITANDDRIYSSGSFDNKHAIEKMSKTDKEKIASCFHDPSVYDGKTVIVLNSTGFLARAGIDEKRCKIFLKILKRYFCPSGKEVLVKLHPYSYPASCFAVDGIQVLGGRENIDAIAYTDYRISCAIDFESTSMEKIANNTDCTMHLGLPAYSQIKYYPIAEFMKNICKELKIGFSQNIIDEKNWNQSSLAKNEDSSTDLFFHLSDEFGKINAECVSNYHYKPAYDGKFKFTVSSNGCNSYSVCLSIHTDSYELWNQLITIKARTFGDLAIQCQELQFNKILPKYKLTTFRKMLGGTHRKADSRSEAVATTEWIHRHEDLYGIDRWTQIYDGSSPDFDINQGFKNGIVGGTIVSADFVRKIVPGKRYKAVLTLWGAEVAVIEGFVICPSKTIWGTCIFDGCNSYSISVSIYPIDGCLQVYAVDANTKQDFSDKCRLLVMFENV